ncbi:MAG: endopeptidase La [Deltaproteobacteria bacterium]|nr:endopeptidase La [Deltaproteobacteria bacterium]
MSAPGGQKGGAPLALEVLGILPLRNSVLFPTSVVPVNVGRPRSVRLVRDLLGAARAVVGVLAQRSPDIEEPSFDELYAVGTVARVVKVIRLGPSNYSVVLSGLGRLRVEGPVSLEPYMRARIVRIPERVGRDVVLEALGATLRESTREVLALMPNLPRETAHILDQVREPGALADLIAANFPPSEASVADKQKVIEAFEPRERVKLVLDMVAPQLEVLRVKKEISSIVDEQSTPSQRKDMLRQQMRTIRQALGEEDAESEHEELLRRILEAKVPPEVEKVARKQIARLSTMAPQSAEYNVARTYVEWIADLPWSKTTEDSIEVGVVRRCLDEDHRGLERVKKRIVEYAAIRQLRRDKKGPILLFVGPPGVGKTSLGRSIARAMGRRYERIALGGVRDEAEIRGHRRTYVGALPGRILAALKRAGTRNPVLVLDEIEKMGADLHGDPAAALLEVLDPEQNYSFRDHYLELDFDLSQVLFIGTANQREGIPPALLDRMELIEIPGYTRIEKVAIAREHLVPKQLAAHGLSAERLDFSDEGLAALVDYYTQEGGVRELERQIGALCRAAAMELADGKDVHHLADADHVERVLGPHKHEPERAERRLRPGVATGLASSAAGGQILLVEASKMPGTGQIVLTGNMRNIMKEAAATAVSYVRSKAERLGLDREWLKGVDLHLHIPQHGTPKDGPAAGVAMFAALSSLLLGCPVRADVAMIGEMSLRGRVLAADGLSQKLLAAHRAGIETVLVPESNRSDLEEIPAEVRGELCIRFISSVEQVLPLVLQEPER